MSIMADYTLSATKIVLYIYRVSYVQVEEVLERCVGCFLHPAVEQDVHVHIHAVDAEHCMMAFTYRPAWEFQCTGTYSGPICIRCRTGFWTEHFNTGGSRAARENGHCLHSLWQPRC